MESNSFHRTSKILGISILARGSSVPLISESKGSIESTCVVYSYWAAGTTVCRQLDCKHPL